MKIFDDLIQILLEVFPKSLSHKKSTLVQVMA